MAKTIRGFRGNLDQERDKWMARQRERKRGRGDWPPPLHHFGGRHRLMTTQYQELSLYIGIRQAKPFVARDEACRIYGLTTAGIRQPNLPKHGMKTELRRLGLRSADDGAELDGAAAPDGAAAIADNTGDSVTGTRPDNWQQ